MSGTTMKTLLIDNYDSFTYNLFQLLGEVDGQEPEVVRNDEASWDELAREGFDNVVVSPGPGRPADPADFGVCADAIRRAEVPLLGVCLGHQGICAAFGATVGRAPEAVHGRLSTVTHTGSPLFAGIPREFEAVRYHSLCVDPATLPDELEPLAWSADGVLMAVAHRTRPLWGVQFHPESIATQHGHRLLSNFRDLTAAATATRRPQRQFTDSGRITAGICELSEDGNAERREESEMRLLVERIDTDAEPEAAFAALYAESQNAFWLDSARLDGGRGAGPSPDRGARFSFMGDDGGPFGAVVTYDVAAGEVTVARRSSLGAGGETVETHAETIFDYLRREQARLRAAAATADLPFDFACGFAGYLGYELKADCGCARAHDSPQPDAAFVFADRMLAFDHQEGHTYLLCLTDTTNAADAASWVADTARTLAETGDCTAAAAPGPVEFTLARSRERHLDDIAVCRERLLDGETYEVCLTNRIEADLGAATDPLALYRELRAVNPAPFAAYLRFGDVAVLGSSPERFLRVGRDGRAEAKPIKGTAPRGVTPAQDARLAAELRASEKDRAENLMIADLLRNDLGRVCALGSVEAPHLMEVESYATVHQLVSTVRGRLRADVAAADAVRACFPPGSMTGAPKRRTTEILDELEQAPRGVYSGALGYFGAGGGCDLAVTIRTIVLDGFCDAQDSRVGYAGNGAPASVRATIGVGGAIVAQSDPDDEYREALLKGEAPMRAIDPRAALAAAPTADRPERSAAARH